MASWDKGRKKFEEKKDYEMVMIKKKGDLRFLFP